MVRRLGDYGVIIVISTFKMADARWRTKVVIHFELENWVLHYEMSFVFIKNKRRIKEDF